MKNLPLSWIFSTEKVNSIEPIKLFRHSSIWLALVSSPKIEFIEEINLLYSNNKILIRGCNEQISNELLKYNYKRINTGREAVLYFNKNHFQKRSLKELIRRGLRHGKVFEYEYSVEIAEKLNTFKNRTSHAKKPQLEYLFWTKFIPGMKLFTFENYDKEWLGAVMVSKNSDSKFHSELLLRKAQSPVGIMEALIYSTFNKLKLAGAKEFSLGEVPFITSTNKNIRNSKEFILSVIGKSLHFAYNYKGLYKFKNKFSPHWDNIYLCGKPNISFLDLFYLSNKTRFSKLILYKMIYRN